MKADTSGSLPAASPRVSRPGMFPEGSDQICFGPGRPCSAAEQFRRLMLLKACDAALGLKSLAPGIGQGGPRSERVAAPASFCDRLRLRGWQRASRGIRCCWRVGIRTRGRDLASQPTLSRFERSAGETCWRRGLQPIERQRRRRKGVQIVIDFDPDGGQVEPVQPLL